MPALSVLQYLRYFDFRLYLPDDILAKVDRASMARSLEVRSPFLDPALVGMSWTLADDCFVRGGERKRITRALFTSAVGGELLQQRKFGFGLPMREWLAGPLREQVEAAVEHVAGRPEVCAFAGEPRAVWQRVLAGDRRSVHRVWLMYAFWRWSQQWEVAPRLEAACP